MGTVDYFYGYLQRSYLKMKTAVLVLGAIFANFAFFVTADDNSNYYLPEEETIGTRREGGEYYDAYPVPPYTTGSGVSTASEKQGIDETTMVAALPGIASLLGVIALAWAQANDHQNQQNEINDQRNKQTRICTAVRALTGTTLTAPSITAGDASDDALNTAITSVITLINGIADPACT